MTNTITVYATKPSALRLIHPTNGPMTEDGAQWPKDSFTNRRLVDGSISRDNPKASKKDDAVKTTDVKTTDVKPVDFKPSDVKGKDDAPVVKSN